jgi:hypothetical protein
MSEWATLYQAAIKFKESAPWEWMDNEELFSVENPDNDEVGYCSILGSGGEEFGLGMFVGEDGYDRYIRLIEEETEAEELEESTMARSISFLLVDRDVLQKEDLELIRSLGLRFRGRNAWPFFRSQEPGYVPWFLEKGEAVFLTAAVQQALIVADEVRSSKLDLVERVSENLILTRYCREGRWDEEWRSAPLSSQSKENYTENIDPVKEAELHMLQDKLDEHSGFWELDIFMLPVPIGSASEKPHFPLCFLAVESKLGLIVGTNLTEPWLTFSEKQDEVIQILRRAKQLPGEMRVKSEKVRRIVEPITSILGIKLRLTSLSMLEEAKASLYERFSGQKL